MPKTLFLRRFDRGLPGVVVVALLVLIAIAVTTDLTASRAADSNAAFVPTGGPPAAFRGVRVDGEPTGIPRECDLKAGISTDCLFMD